MTIETSGFAGLWRPGRNALLALTMIVVGSCFFLTPAHAQFVTVFNFPPGTSTPFPLGRFPLTNIVEVSPGVFIGTASAMGGGFTSCGPAGGCGTIVKIDTNGQSVVATLLHLFKGTEGSTPKGVLTLASDGMVYGTTASGGSSASCTNCGTVFRIGTDGSGFEVVHTFNGSAAATPDGMVPVGIAQGTDGNLYGSTQFGGVPQNYGTVFVIEPPYGPTAPYSALAFPMDQSLGARPQVPLQASDGMLYGLACCGAAPSIYRLTASPLAFAPPPLLTTPDAGFGALVEGPGGALYGVSTAGGANHIGSLLRATFSTSASTLYSFAGGPTDGQSPEAGLLLASDGMLYGTTAGGGDAGCSGCGTVFGLLPGTSGKFALLHIFKANPDGGFPEAPLVEGSDGYVYGTATQYGVSGGGTVFRFPKSTLAQWDQQFGDVGLRDSANSVVADALGNVYVAGVAGTRLDPKGTGTFTIARFKSDGTLDTKFNSSGYVQFGPGLSTDYMARIRLDKGEKNIYVAGYSAGNLFPDALNSGGFDGWVAKFNTKGKRIWAHMLGTPQDDRLFDIALDPAGKIYVSGSTTGNLGGTLHGVRDAFVGQLAAKLNKVTKQYDFTLVSSQSGTAGETRWGRRVAYCKSVGPPQVYADGDDVVSGNAWLSRFNAKNIPGGSLKTVTLAGGSGPGFFEAHGVGADSSCNVYMAGHNVSHPLASITDEYFYVNKYDSLLNNHLWEVDGPLNSGGIIAPEDFIYDLAVDSSDRVFVGGTTSSLTLFGGGNKGQDAPWYAAYYGTGKKLGSAVVQFAPGSSVVTEGLGIFANTKGVFMVGNTNGNVAGHPDPIFSDAYVYAFPPLP